MPHTLLVPISRPMRGVGGGEHRCRDGVANRGQSSTTTRPGSIAHVAALILDDVRTPLLSLCTSRCRETNACEPHVQHFYTGPADPGHSQSGQTSPAPAVAHWRGCLPARQGPASSTGGIRPGSLMPWCGWREDRMLPRCPAVSAMRARAPSRRCFRKALGKTPRDYFTHRAVSSRHGSLRDIASLGA
jgi:hypothetical protein